MTDTEIVKVDLGNRSYDIVIGENLLSGAIEDINKELKPSCAIIVTDKNIPSEYIDSLHGSKAKLSADRIIKLPPGEATKSFENLELLLDQIFEQHTDRKMLLIALGGGVIGDLVGFAASILLRGVNFVQIPTTLLAQVDSSVGGKTGINHKTGKNVIGAFHQPKQVIVDISTLSSLSKRDFLSGYAEVVKYGLINDKKFFNWLDENLDKILHKDTDALKYLIKTSCTAKAAIVAQDEREGGVRALLNLGHTFGHALEQQMGYDGRLLHGEAVSIGMVFAFKLSKNLGLCKEEDVKKVITHLKRAGLHTSPLDIHDKWDETGLLNAMYKDKKSTGGQIVFVLAKGIGESFIEKNVDDNVISDTIKSVINNN